MIVCHCRAVTDREIRNAIQCGARTPRAIARACGAGGRCGGCREAVVDLLDEAHAPACLSGTTPLIGSAESASAPLALATTA